MPYSALSHNDTGEHIDKVGKLNLCFAEHLHTYVMT